MSFAFDSPLLATAALIIIPLAAFILSRLKNPFVALIPLGAPGGVPFKTSQFNGIVILMKILETIGIILLFLSAAGPSLKTSETVWLNRGADIIFILDASPSMAAMDMDGGNRFNAARNLLLDFANRRPSDNIGLVAVGEDAALLLPPTADRDALNNRLEQLRIGELGDGTALGTGIAVAAYHLEKSNAKRKVAVLITDGENNAGSIHPETAAALLRDTGSSFWVIAVGSAGEVPIDYVDPYTRIRRTGIFDSRYDTESLRQLSVSGGGTFITALSSDAFNSAFLQLDEAEITVQRARVINRKRSLSLQFLIPAVLLLTAVRFVKRNLQSKQKFPPQLQRKLTLSFVTFCLFAAFSIIAMADPKWGTGSAQKDYHRGLDTIYAIDVSRSMDIRDAQSGDLQSHEIQSRLERGLSIARESAINVQGARYAAAIGRNRGYLAVPLTFENEAVLSFFEAVNVQSITGRSTNLEALLDAATDAFQSSSVARKVIVLISDGESHSGNIRNAINRCIRERIVVAAVAAGSDEGRAVPDSEADGAVSRRDAAAMRQIAERTGGIYIDASREDAASLLSSFLSSMTQEMPGSQSEPKQRRALFIILALIAYGASKFILRMSGKNKVPAALAVSLLVVLTLSGCSESKLLLLEANYLFSRGRYDEAVIPYQKALEHEDSAPYAEYGLGLIYHSIEDNMTALNRYNNSKKLLEKLSDSEHRELRFRNYYNSGVVYFEKDDFHSAAEAFREALKTDPARIEAKRNLELALLSITMETNSNNQTTETHNESREILFDLIRLHEQQKWKSGEWAPEEKFTGPDY